MRVDTVYDVDPELHDPRARGDGDASLDLDSRGQIVVAAGTWAGVIRSESGEIVRRLDGVGPGRRTVGLCRFLPGGREVAAFCSGSTAGFHFWDPADGSEVDRLSSPDAGPIDAASPDGRLALVRTDPATAAVWSLPERRIVRWLETRGVTAFAFADEDTLALGREAADGRSHVVGLVPVGETKTTLARVAARSSALAASGPAALCAAGADGILRLLRRGERLEPGQEFALPDSSEFAGTFAVRNDGAAIAAFGRELPGWLVRTNDGAVLAFATARAVTEARFSPDGRRLYAVGENGLLRAWNVDLEDRR